MYTKLVFLHIIVVVHNLECLGSGWMLCSSHEFYLPYHHQGKDRQKWYVYFKNKLYHQL